MSNRTLSLAVVILLILGVLTSAVVVMQNQQLLILADSVERISEEADRIFTIVQKRAMGSMGQSESVVMHVLRSFPELGVAVAVPAGAPGLIEVNEEDVSFGSDDRLPTAVLRVTRSAVPDCQALVFIGDKDYRGTGSRFDPDKALIEDPDRFHVYGPEDLCGATIVVLPRAE